MTEEDTMTAPDGSATTRRPARTRSTRARLFRASMDLFGERGPAGVSIDEIAAAAGVSKGTVYYNFSSKSGLVGELLAFGVDLMEERLSVRLDDPDPVRRAAAMIDRALDFFEEYPSFMRLWMSEIWRTATDSDWHSALITLRDRLLGLVRGVLEEIAAVRPVDPAVPAERLAVAVTGSALFYGLHMQAVDTEEAPHAARAEALATLMTPITGWVRN